MAPSSNRLLAIHLSSIEKFWQGLIATLEAADLADDARFSARLSRIEHYEILDAELGRRCAAHTLAELARWLGENDVPYAPINIIDEVVRDAQVGHLGLMVPVQSPHGASTAVRPPVQFEGSRGESVTSAPLLYGHGGEIRASLAKHGGWPARPTPAA